VCGLLWALLFGGWDSSHLPHKVDLKVPMGVVAVDSLKLYSHCLVGLCPLPYTIRGVTFEVTVHIHGRYIIFLSPPSHIWRRNRRS
jgi:hypothetical protein